MEYTMTPPTVTAPQAIVPVIQYAGFWRRFGAYLIDSILLWTVMTAIGMIFGVGMMGMFVPFNGASSTHVDPAASAAVVSGMFLMVLIYMVGSWLYFALMESSAKEATLGKMAVGLRVTDLEGHRISFGRATGRYLGKIISSIILCIGYIMVGFTEKKQGLHDMIAGTLVLSRQSAVPSQVAQNAFT